MADRRRQRRELDNLRENLGPYFQRSSPRSVSCESPSGHHRSNSTGAGAGGTTGSPNMSQRNRSGRGSNRSNGNNAHGEEVQIWDLCKSQMADIVMGVNADNDNLSELVTLDRKIGTMHGEQNVRDCLMNMELMCRNGVKHSEANVSSIKAVMEQLKIMRAVVVAKEQAEGGGPSAPTAKRTARGDAAAAAAAAATAVPIAAASLYEFDVAVDSPVPSPKAANSSRRFGDRSSNRDRDSIPPKAESVEPQGSTGTAVGSSTSASAAAPVPVPIASAATTAPSTTAAAAATAPTVAAPIAAALPATTTTTSITPITPITTTTTPTTGTTTTTTTTAAAASAAAAAAAAAAAVNSIKSRIVFAKGDSVAFRPKVGGEGVSDWILGEVLQVLGEGKSRRYKVLDIEPDDQSKQKEYRTSASSMIPITPESQAGSLKAWEAGQVVLALYPNTTTFYKAEVYSMDGQGRVDLKFEGENDSTTTQQVERRFVIEYRA
ncbi:hypothetical protein E4U13_002266 [Claviceps humidiphila]|uniref:SGF29 C-terminal domain-containing protein n=1 Tax=Claviceps humidiphila TaxID=1294629 RepID=A0A9P7TXJ3_9HYPO|nr:hypothetical protein E4U13_002266 [Claviceps humidiphila]